LGKAAEQHEYLMKNIPSREIIATGLTSQTLQGPAVLIDAPKH